MGLMNVALPQKRSSISGPVGSSFLAADAENLITMADGSVWIRGGAFGAAGSYPAAAALEHLRAIAFSNAATPMAIAATYFATNDTGTIFGVIAAAGSNDGTRSVDGGNTWAAVNLSTPLGGQPHWVGFLNNKFWALFNDATNIVAAESATGAAGTWTTRTILSGGAGNTASSSRMEWTGTNYVVVTQTSTAAQGAYTSPDGITWTSRGAGSSWNSTSHLAAANSGGRVIAQSNTGGTYNYSADHGVTWSPISFPTGTGSGPVTFSVGTRLYVSQSTIGVWSTTDPSAQANWSRVNLPTAIFNRSGALTVVNSVAASGRAAARDFLYAGSSYAGYLIRFDANGNAALRRSNKSNYTTNAGACVVGTNYVSFPGASSTVNGYANCSWDTFNAVAGAGYLSATATTYELNTYTRIA